MYMQALVDKMDDQLIRNNKYYRTQKFVFDSIQLEENLLTQINAFAELYSTALYNVVVTLARQMLCI